MSDPCFSRLIVGGRCTLPLLMAFLFAVIPGTCWGKGQNPAICLSAHCQPCCPADYVCKPPVCIPCPTPRCQCDDYCPKPLPNLPCPTNGCQCDNYCPKPAVCLPAAYRNWLKCGPPACSRGGIGK